MYFLIAAKEDPFRSFSAVIAATTIVATGGWAAGALGFLALVAFLTGVFTALDMIVDSWVEYSRMSCVFVGCVLMTE